MKLHRLVSHCLALACCLAVLSACGGGDDDEKPTVTPLPAAPTALPTPEPSATPAVSTPSPTSGSPAAAIAVPDGTPIAVTVILTDFRVSAFQKQFEVGKTYSITIQNNGAATHQFVIEPEGAVNAALSSNGSSSVIAAIEPGASATLIWTFTESGTFQFACHQPGHFEQGMVQPGIVVGE